MIGSRSFQHRCQLLLALVSLLPAAAGAQGNTIEEAMRRRALSDLRNLVTAQERFYSEHNTYATSIKEIAPIYVPSQGVTINILFGRPTGWVGTATAAPMPGSCTMWVGRIEESERPATAQEHKVYPEGSPACDGDGLTPERAWAKDALGEMRGRLLRLVKMEERYFATHNEYTTDLSALGTAPWLKDPNLRVVYAGKNGFGAETKDPRYPGKSCIILDGFDRGMRTLTTAGGARPSEEMSPVCDALVEP